jgi:hypothetical protein
MRYTQRPQPVGFFGDIENLVNTAGAYRAWLDHADPAAAQQIGEFMTAGKTPVADRDAQISGRSQPGLAFDIIRR